jgi:hypothetical protein
MLYSSISNYSAVRHRHQEGLHPRTHYSSFLVAVNGVPRWLDFIGHIFSNRAPTVLAVAETDQDVPLVAGTVASARTPSHQCGSVGSQRGWRDGYLRRRGMRK